MARGRKGTRNKRKFTCGECQAGFFLHWTELNRAAVPRCPGCGSARLTPSGAGADDRARVRAEAADIAYRQSGSFTPKGGV